MSNEFFNFDSPLVGIDKHSYNKAIDDFAEKLKEPLNEWSKNGNASVARGYKNAIALIDEVAEQLKG